MRPQRQHRKPRLADLEKDELKHLRTFNSLPSMCQYLIRQGHEDLSSRLTSVVINCLSIGFLKNAHLEYINPQTSRLVDAVFNAIEFFEDSGIDVVGLCNIPRECLDIYKSDKVLRSEYGESLRPSSPEKIVTSIDEILNYLSSVKELIVRNK